jgi:hypothetical protein
MTAIRATLPPLPLRMQHLPVSEKGYPVPAFVAIVNGKYDFRVADGAFAKRARDHGLCWLCGGVIGKYKVFVIGPMCMVNRTTAEPPCHWDCALYAAMACPFLTLPNAVRREANLPGEAQDPAGVMLTRNPGVTVLWTTKRYSVYSAPNGLGKLIHIGDPEQVDYYREGRRALPEEVIASIESGLPLLQDQCRLDRYPQLAAKQLQRQYEKTIALLQSSEVKDPALGPA